MTRHIIIGNGIAGITAAKSIAKAQPKVEVLVLGAESYPYYPRPRLWELLSDAELQPEDLYFRSLEWYAKRGIEVRTDNRVREILPEAHQIKLADGEKLDYDRLLLATGGRAFVPPVKGVDAEGVFVLRSLDDAIAIRQYAHAVSSAIVIGGGLLGLETARALLEAGVEVTVLEVADYLMPQQLDKEGAQVLQASLEALGLHILTGVVTEAILGDPVSGTRLKDGRKLDGELVLFSTGIRSRTDLARKAGLEVNRGVVVDGELRTSAADIYAAGDVAEFDSIVYGIIPAALEQSQIAAKNMVTAGTASYQGTLRSTSLKIVDVDLTCLGEAMASGPELDVIRHSDAETGVYRRLALKDGKLVGAILLGDTSEANTVKRIMAAGRDLTAEKDKLQNQGFEFKTLTN